MNYHPHTLVTFLCTSPRIAELPSKHGAPAAQPSLSDYCNMLSFGPSLLPSPCSCCLAPSLTAKVTARHMVAKRRYGLCFCNQEHGTTTGEVLVIFCPSAIDSTTCMLCVTASSDTVPVSSAPRTIRVLRPLVPCQTRNG